MSIAVIVPTIRPDEIKEFLVSWQQALWEVNATLYIVEDQEEKSIAIPEMDFNSINLLSWSSVSKELLDCCGKNSPGCRQIGIWQAYEDGHQTFINLDDDVRAPIDNNPLQIFQKILTSGVPRWVDPLLNYPSRGYPKINVGSISSHFHIGGFSVFPDVDAETQLKFQDLFSTHPPMYQDRAILLPTGQYMPVNGGVCGWVRELTPYIHYTLWNEELGYYRFDDIWMGVIAKKILDLSGRYMSYGPPVVAHIRASNLQENLVREKNGKDWNEQFWGLLDAGLPIAGKLSLSEAFDSVVSCLERLENRWAKAEAKALRQWRGFFSTSS